MANETLKIKSAVKAHKRQNLSATHLTTAEIGQIMPLWAVETIIGGKYPVKANDFARLAPLVKPTYGKMYFKTATIFVPYYQICDNFDGWMNGQKKVNGETANSRFIRKRTILEVFSTGVIVTDVSATDVATGAWFDVRCKNNNTDKYYKFTNTGKYYAKVLNSLGYVIPMNGNTYANSTWYKGDGAEFRNALPLIAFAKGYNDWMSQSQRYNSSTLTKLLFGIKHNKTVTHSGNTLYDSTTCELTKWGVIALLDGLRLMYENDYFTQAWQYPNAPIEGEEYTMNGNGQSVDNSQLYGPTAETEENVNTQNKVWRDESGTYVDMPVDINLIGYIGEEEEEPTVYSNGSIQILLAKRTMDWLDAWDRYVKRNNYAGSKDVQQIYARFGIKVEDFKSNYSHLIARSKSPIQIGDITATAQDYVGAGNENNVAIGDYAGKGIISNQNRFKYEANEVGLLCRYAWITTAPMNVYGEDKMVRRTKPIDFYKPEFDGIGPEAIAVEEVYNNPRIWSTTNPKATYGFVEIYNSFRFGRDRITGDFRKMPLDSGDYANVGTEMNVWHLGRFLNTQLMEQTLVAQNPAINQLAQVNSEYNRIFSVTSGDEDHFYITSQVECMALLPILSINQTPGLGEGDTVVTKNGNEVN